MRFLADMGVARDVMQWLRDQGHDAVHLRELEMSRASDREVFEKAADEDRALLTFDLDFSDIVAASGGKTISVILFRLRNARHGRVRERLATCFADLGADIRRGAVVVIEDSRVRIRRLPFGEPS